MAHPDMDYSEMDWCMAPGPGRVCCYGSGTVGRPVAP
jgi:hypothetical protein